MRKARAAAPRGWRGKAVHSRFFAVLQLRGGRWPWDTSYGVLSFGQVRKDVPCLVIDETQEDGGAGRVKIWLSVCLHSSQFLGFEAG